MLVQVEIWNNIRTVTQPRKPHPKAFHSASCSPHTQGEKFSPSRVAPPTPTREGYTMPTATSDPEADDTIAVTMQADAFKPNNTLPHSPKHPKGKLITPPGPPPPPDPAESPGAEHPSDNGTPPNQTDSETTTNTTMEEALKALQSVHDLLNQKSLRAEQKNDARDKMAWAIEQIKAIHATPTQTRSKEKSCPIDTTPPQEKQQNTDNTHRNSMENDIKDIKALLQEALAPRTWAHIAARTPTEMPVVSRRESIEVEHEERMEKFRRERAKTEVTLTTRHASEHMKGKIAGMNEGEVTRSVQEAAKQIGAQSCNIRAARCTASHGVKIRCATEKDVKELRGLDWEQALEGAAVVKPLYGIVIHGVPKYDIDPGSDKQEDMKTQVENANNENITVKRVTLLRKRARNPAATTQSIVTPTECPEEADSCITDGINIEHRHYHAERYLPQCQIKQCFNCQAYWHRADTCTRQMRCGKCGQQHETRLCENETLQCIGCKGSHPAWHHECPICQRESQRVEALKNKLSSLFTS